jgi:hypothetical protein
VKAFNRRLEKIAGEYTAKERAVLLLRSLHDELNRDEVWRTSMPPEQWSEFNQYATLLNAANLELVNLVCSLALRTDTLEEQYLRLLLLHGWASDAHELRRLARRSLPHPAVKDLYGSCLTVEIEGALEESLRASLAAAWCDLRAVARVLDEIGEVFDGLDPLAPDNRYLLNLTQERLQELADRVGVDSLSEPDEDQIERVREFARKREEVSRNITWYRPAPQGRSDLD